MKMCARMERTRKSEFGKRIITETLDVTTKNDGQGWLAYVEGKDERKGTPPIIGTGLTEHAAILELKSISEFMGYSVRIIGGDA